VPFEFEVHVFGIPVPVWGEICGGVITQEKAVEIRIILYDGLIKGEERIDQNTPIWKDCLPGIGGLATWEANILGTSHRITPPIDVCASITLDFDNKKLVGEVEASVNFPNWSGLGDRSEKVQHTWINW
jgi:hypothetical protein